MTPRLLPATIVSDGHPVLDEPMEAEGARAG
jgi:hypothetical protein